MSAVFFMMAMIARTYAEDRTLTFASGRLGDLIALHFSFRGERDGDWYPVLERLYRAVESCHEYVFDCTYRDGEICLCFCPYYEDVGALGVKRGHARLREGGEAILFDE